MLPVHQAIATAVAQMTVQSIGIANGNGCDNAIVLNGSLSAVAHRVARLAHQPRQPHHGFHLTVEPVQVVADSAPSCWRLRPRGLCSVGFQPD